MCFFSLVFSWDFFLFVNTWLDIWYHCVSISFCWGLFPKIYGCVLIINWYIDDCLFLYFFGVMLTLACLLYTCARRLADSYGCLLFLMHVYYILSCTLKDNYWLQFLEYLNELENDVPMIFACYALVFWHLACWLAFVFCHVHCWWNGF